MTVVGISLVPLHKYRHFQTILSNELWYVVLGQSVYLLPGMIAQELWAALSEDVKLCATSISFL